MKNLAQIHRTGSLVELNAGRVPVKTLQRVKGKDTKEKMNQICQKHESIDTYLEIASGTVHLQTRLNHSLPKLRRKSINC